MQLNDEQIDDIGSSLLVFVDRIFRQKGEPPDQIVIAKQKVIDLCAQAKLANSGGEVVANALLSAQRVLTGWQDKYAEWSDDLPSSMDRRLPPAGHITALEDIREALTAIGRRGVYWLVEWDSDSGTRFLCKRGRGGSDWSFDATEAHKFDTKESAEQQCRVEDVTCYARDHITIYASPVAPRG